LSRVLARAGERGELFKPLVLQGYLLRLVLSAFPDQSIDVLGDFLNLPPRRLVVDRLFHSLISLFGREEHDRLHADHASSSYGQRDGGHIRVVRHVKDEISGVFAEGPSIMLAYMLSEHPITS
jgi:hypothetical protein